MSDAEQSEFWAFTLASYPREGVQQSVIGLQDRRGADVNLLFFCCYIAARGSGRLRGEDLAAAEAAIEPWRRQVTLPLRALRDHIKGTEALWEIAGASEVRGKVLGAEIESERIAQGIIEAAAPRSPDDGPTAAERRGDARANLEAYLAFLSVQPDEEDLHALEVLLAGTFPQEGSA